MTEDVILSAINLLEFFLGEMVAPMSGMTHQVLLEEKAVAVKGSESESEEEEDLKGLKSDLMFMLDFVRSESARSRSPHHLISQVREMAYDVGVIFETFLFPRNEELEESESIRLKDFLTEIKSARSRFRLVKKKKKKKDKKKKKKISFQSGVGDTEDFGWKRELAPDDDDDVVGLEKFVEDLVNKFVLLDDRHLYSFAMYGMGGIGKTTLARMVYNHAATIQGFERRAWACISDEFKLEEVLRVLIRQVGDISEEGEEVMEEMDVESLQQMLRHHLEGTSYFIILDDMWDAKSYKCVSEALPEDNLSRVVITTRFPSELPRINAWKFPNMNFDTSWQLFLKTVFTSEFNCPKHLEKIGRKIVEKCNGLPLAIKEVGRQLTKERQSESAWEEFMESMDFTETIRSLELSYHIISPCLKSIFVHMSFFREGTNIKVEKFVHIWSVVRMVTRAVDKADLSTEEIAIRYLEKLSEASMIKLDIRGKSFRLISFFQKIAITKAKEEIGFQILGNARHSPPPCKPRHRAVCCSREKFNYSTNQDKHLLSLFFWGGGNFDTSASYWESFEQLRILEVNGFGLRNLPKEVCLLVRLRYLGLRDNYLQELPQRLGRLFNLEVLDIAMNFMLEVPDIIWEMDRLQHLFMSDIICRTPLRIDSLKYLKTLTYISVNNWIYELSNLEKMTSLRKLGIEDLDEASDVSKLFLSVAKLRNLKCIILRGFRFRSMPSLDGLSDLHDIHQIKLDGRLTKLPKFPQNINYLALVNSCLQEDPMPELEKLFWLDRLKLRNAYTGQEMVFSGHRLRFFCIRELRHLRKLRVEKRCGFHFQRFEIASCPYLSSIPEEMIDFGEWCTETEGFKMVTTKKIDKLLQQSGITSKPNVNIYSAM